MHQVFFSLEKYKAKQKTISSLKLDNGTLINDGGEILEECRRFYSELYSKNLNIDENVGTNFFQNSDSPKLNLEQKEYCDRSIDEDEILKCLKTFKRINVLEWRGSQQSFI